MELNMIPDFSWKVVITHLQPINMLNTPINQDLQRVKSHPVLPKVNRATTKPRLSGGVSRVSDAVATP
jgi:hypothetical protein